MTVQHTFRREAAAGHADFRARAADAVSRSNGSRVSHHSKLLVKPRARRIGDIVAQRVAERRERQRAVYCRVVSRVNAQRHHGKQPCMAQEVVITCKPVRGISWQKREAVSDTDWLRVVISFG